MPEQHRQQDQHDRTGEYGGDDGALEHEREVIVPGEDAGLTGTPTGQTTRGGKNQAEREQERDLATGEENPG